MYTRVPPLPTAHTSRRGCGQRGLALLCTVSCPISWQSRPWKNWPPADTLGLWVTQEQSTHFLEEKLWVLLVERLPREPCDPLLVAEKIVTNLPTCQWLPYANLKFNFHNFAHSVNLIWCSKCKSLKFTLQNIQIAKPLLPINLYYLNPLIITGSLASPPLPYCDLYTHTQTCPCLQPDANFFPSGDHAMHMIQCLCDLHVCRAVSMVTSQNLTVVSPDPLASCLIR